MATYEFSYTGSVTPKPTKHLTVKPLNMNFSGSLDLDASDGSIFTRIQKEFQKQMANRINTQLAFLNDWLKEKDELIEHMITEQERLKKLSSDQQYHKSMGALKEIAKQIPELPRVFQRIVQDWAENCREQQGLIAMSQAVKIAEIKVLQGKAFRVRAGVTVKALLIVSVFATSVAALIASASTTNPVFVVISSIGVLISGIAGLAQITTMVVKTISIEKLILKNAQKDVDAVLAAFGSAKAKGSDLAKHVEELSNAMKVRSGHIEHLRMKSLEYRVDFQNRYIELGELRADPSVDQKAIAAKRTEVEKVMGQLKSVAGKIEDMNNLNKASQKLLNSLSELNISLDALTGQKPITFLESLKNHFSNLDNLNNYLNTVGSWFSNAGGMHS